jgi:hypothetical protein
MVKNPMTDKLEPEFDRLDRFSKMQNDLEELQECFVDISDILEGEKKKPSPQEDNVVYIAPFIFREFEAVKDLPMSADQVISIYLEWAEKLYIIAALNKGKYKNKAVKIHMHNLYALLKTIEKIFVKEQE